MKAILTKYHGWTNYRPSRISASDMDGNRVIVSVPSIPFEGGDPEAQHRFVAEKLCEKMNWGGKLVGGATKDGMAFCFADFHDPRDKKGE